MNIKESPKITICETKYAYGYKPLTYLPDDFIVGREKETKSKSKFKYGKNRGVNNGKKEKES